MKTLSVIIPTLNEQAHLRSLLDDLRQQREVSLQIILADGGSHDGTRQAAKNLEWVDAPLGRGAQMNAGRQHAQHELLLFLHADSRLADEYLLSHAVDIFEQQPSNTAGHFGLRFADAPGNHGFYRHLEAKSRLNRPETINGDQGLLIKHSFFDALGGFDQSLPFLEDQAISESIFRQGQWIVLPGELHTSARRFEQEGRAERYFLMMLIMCARKAGMNSFFEQAKQLYPEQNATDQIKVSPFLELILQLGNEHPGFWLRMAEYCLDNSWQVAFIFDQWLQRPVFLPLYDQGKARWPKRLITPLLAPALKMIFNGPVLSAIQRKERHG